MHRPSTSQATLRLGISFSTAVFMILLLSIFMYKSTPAVTPTSAAPATLSTGTVSALVPTQTVLATQTPTLANVQLPPPEVSKAIIADWEEMFRTINSYEYAVTNDQLDDRAWWVEQAKKFYIGRARSLQLQSINQMFGPDTLGAPGFIENARYILKVESCSSDNTECTLKVSLQEGKFWAYSLGSKSWDAANAVEPATWLVIMQYDPISNQWKIKG